MRRFCCVACVGLIRLLASQEMVGVPEISPELQAIAIDVDGDGVYTEAEKMAVQMWVDTCGGDLKELLYSAEARPDGGIDASAFFGMEPKGEAREEGALPEAKQGGSKQADYTCADCEDPVDPMTTIVVPDDYATIKQAVEAANQNPQIELICVRASEYVEQPMVITENLTILACSGQITVKRASPGTQALVLVSNSSLWMQNFTFEPWEVGTTEGNFVRADYGQTPAAAHTFALANCKFLYLNALGQSFRAVRVASHEASTNPPTVEILGCYFQENFAGGLRIGSARDDELADRNMGGGFQEVVINGFDSVPTEFESNSRPNGIGGGALCVVSRTSGGTVRVGAPEHELVFFENNSALCGGGLYCATPNVRISSAGGGWNVHFDSNSATGTAAGTRGGGGLYLKIFSSGGTLEIRRTGFIANHINGSSEGGGACVELEQGTESAVMRACQFGANDDTNHNTSWLRRGGGLYLVGWANKCEIGPTWNEYEENPDYNQGLEFLDNGKSRCRHYGMGAYIDVQPNAGASSPSIWLKHCRFTQNCPQNFGEAGGDSRGGGLCLVTHQGWAYKVLYCRFLHHRDLEKAEDDQPIRHGGGMYIDSTLGGDVILGANDFQDNWADWYGGAVYRAAAAAYPSSLLVQSCGFYQNRGWEAAGALGLAMLQNVGEAKVVNCTFRENWSEGANHGWAVAVVNASPGSALFGNCIFWDNDPDGQSDLWSPNPATNFPLGVYNTMKFIPVSWQDDPENVVEDPLFVGGQDPYPYQLTFIAWNDPDNSPCINTGYREGQGAAFGLPNNPPTYRLLRSQEGYVGPRGYFTDRGTWEYMEMQPLLRGDANADGNFNIADAQRILMYLFTPGETDVWCHDALDANDDGAPTLEFTRSGAGINIADATYILNYLFGQGYPPPPPPFPEEGPDPTRDSLGCEAWPDPTL